MKNVVTVYTDCASLQYQLWGDQWDVGVDKVITTIHLPYLMIRVINTG